MGGSSFKSESKLDTSFQTASTVSKFHINRLQTSVKTMSKPDLHIISLQNASYNFFMLIYAWANLKIQAWFINIFLNLKIIDFLIFTQGRRDI